MQHEEKPILAVDLDDTAVTYRENILDYGVKEYGIRIVLPTDGSPIDLESVMGEGNKPLGRERVIAFERDGHIFHCNPVPGVYDALSILRYHYRIWILTHRSPTLEELTLRAINLHFPEIIDRITLCGNPCLPHESHELKHVFCTREGVHTIVDDKISTIQECRAAGINTVLFDPWKRVLPQEPIGEVATAWPEAVTYLLRPFS